MRHFSLCLAALVGGFLIAGCSSNNQKKTIKPLPEPQGMLFCGIERTNPLGQGYDQAGRDCLWDAWRRKKSAELTIVLDGDQRAQAEYHVQIMPDRWVKIAVAHYREGEVRSIDYECRDLDREEVPGLTHRAGFVARSCRGGFNRVIHIP